KEIASYIARDSPEAARRWLARLQERARLAAETPFAGRVVPEFSVPDLREVLVGNYRIVYRVGSEAIQVIAVFEGHRLLPSEPPDLKK
ncbi:MAG TPA: type II toxin-antitoxin system RelE/ParE family toxin, partial [Thermoanaerobaculia bacterium]|nr:type II toxin-antitoxin system RelE/ParE family toxin [Thermoanaerobaculia bacterium]